MKARGFTLIELVVALVLAGTVVAIGTAAVAFMTDRHAAITGTSAEVAHQAHARHELGRWIAGAVIPRDVAVPFRGVDAERDRVADDMLSFLTTAPTGSPGRYTRVRLFVDRDATTPGTGLVAELTPWRGRDTMRVEIETAVTSVDIRYVRGSARAAFRTWASGSDLPRGVELRFSGDSLPSLFRIPLVVAVGDAR